MVCTNGVLISRRIAQFFREQHVSVAVGCDGPADDHAAIRRDTHGNATYSQVAAAIKTLVAENVTTFASASITPHNLPRIGEFSDFFAGLGVAKFGFNFLRASCSSGWYHLSSSRVLRPRHRRRPSQLFQFRAAPP